MNTLIEMAAHLFREKMGAGSNLNGANIVTALQRLLPTRNGELDLSDLVARLSGRGGSLKEKANSWLGDGANQEMTDDDVDELFGRDSINSVASELGLHKREVSGGLARALPELIDNSSEGGELVDNAISRLGKKLLVDLF